MTGSTYRDAGVDRAAAERAKERIAALARTTFTPGVVGDIGFFGASFRVEGFRDPVLVSHTDSVGTKVRVASLMGRYDTVGEDIVHHCVNDILTCRARPLFFLDYIGMGALAPERVETLVAGMARACRGVGCALIGGETAELPGIYKGDDLDLVGFVVGAVERDEVPQPQEVRPGDALLGLPSSGLHTNGFSLVRRIFGIDDDPRVLEEHVPRLETTLGDALLVPHRSYYPLLAPVLPQLKGMAHITGGGFEGNVPRCLPKGVAARIYLDAWEVPPIFRLVQERGQVEEAEMYRVFNMGVGMVLVVAPEALATVQAAVPEARVVGEVVKGAGDPTVELRTRGRA